MGLIENHWQDAAEVIKYTSVVSMFLSSVNASTRKIYNHFFPLLWKLPNKIWPRTGD